MKRITSKWAGRSIWQKGYYDRIIRNETDYLRIWSYIDTNPAKWGEDEYYTPDATQRLHKETPEPWEKWDRPPILVPFRP